MNIHARIDYSMTCKAGDLSEIEVIVPKTDDISDDIREVSDETVYGEKLTADWSPCCDDFVHPQQYTAPQYFILLTMGRRFLINTEGFGYARYVVELVD